MPSSPDTSPSSIEQADSQYKRTGAAAASRFWQDIWSAGLLFFLSFTNYLFLWWPWGHSTIGKDYIPVQPGPQLVFMQAVRDGFFPLWSPGDGGGVSIAASLFSGQYWPVTWLMLAFDISFDGLQIEILTFVRLLSLGMSGFFVYLLMRRLNLDMWPAVFAGVVFMLNLRMLDSFRYGVGLDSVIWLPVMVYLAERVVSRPSIRLAVFYALAQYMLLVSGHFQKASYCMIFANVYLLVRSLMMVPGGSWRERIKWLAARAVCLGAGQAVGLGLTAVLVLPVVRDFLPILEYRAKGDLPFRLEHVMTWQDGTCNLFYPWLADVHSGFYCAQIVWILFVLAGISLLIGRRHLVRQDRNMLVFLFAVFLFCIAYSLGSPVHGVTDAVFTLFKSFRAPGRIMIVGVFAMAGISAYALQGILNDVRSRAALSRLMISGCLVFLLAGLALTFVLATGSVHWGEVVNGHKRLWLPLLGDIAHYSPARLNNSPEMIPIMAAVVIAVALVNLVIVVVWRRRNFSPLLLVQALLVVALVETGIYHRRGTWLVPGRYYTQCSDRFPLADVYHTRIFQPLPFFMVAGKNVVKPRPGSESAVSVSTATVRPMREFLTDGGAPAWRIYFQNVPGHEIPRAYVTPGVELVEGNDLAAITEMDPYRVSVIDVSMEANRDAVCDAALLHLEEAGRNVDPDRARERFDGLNSDFEVTGHTFNRAVFQVGTDTGGLLNYSDRYAEGWRATIDGKETRVYRSNHALKAVVLPPGRHRVEFHYDPPSFRTGFAVSLVCLCLLVGMVGASFGRTIRGKLLLGLCAAALAIPGVYQLHRRVYQMVNQPGLINYDPDAPRARALDYHEHLASLWAATKPGP